MKELLMLQSLRYTENLSTGDRSANSHEVGKTLATNRESTEAGRRLSAESVDVLRKAGLLRMAVPKRHGGDERDFRDIGAAVVECTRG